MCKHNYWPECKSNKDLMAEQEARVCKLLCRGEGIKTFLVEVPDKPTRHCLPFQALRHESAGGLPKKAVK